MIIRKKTLDKLIAESKNEVWESVRKRDELQDLWQSIGNNRREITDIKKRLDALENPKGGKK